MNNLHDVMAHLRNNHGAAGARDLQALGLSRDQIARLCEIGVLASPCRSTYVSTTVRPTTHHRIMTAVAAARQAADRPDLVAASRDTAAWLLGLTDQRRRPTRLHLVVPHARMPSPQLPGGVVVHRSRTLTLDQITEVDDVPTTDANRTIVDSAINHAVRELCERIARALQREIATLPSLSETFAGAGRIRGRNRLTQAMLEIDPDVRLSQSLGEEAGRQALIDAGYDVASQHPVEDVGQQFLADLALVSLGIIVEIDGYWWHSTPAQHAADITRQNVLIEIGWRVLRFPAARVLRDPSIVPSSVAKALASPVGRGCGVGGFRRP